MTHRREHDLDLVSGLSSSIQSSRHSGNSVLWPAIRPLNKAPHPIPHNDGSNGIRRPGSPRSNQAFSSAVNGFTAWLVVGLRSSIIPGVVLA
jgi:hypothetical protein